MRRQMVTTMYNKFNYLIKACFPWMLCSSSQFEIWVILYISIHIGRYLAQKRFLNFIRLASFSVYRLTLIGENNRRNGNGGDQGGSYQCSDLLLLSWSITCLQNLYYVAIYLIPTTLETLKISLLFPCHEPITIEIASATAGLFYGTVYPLM